MGAVEKDSQNEPLISRTEEDGDESMNHTIEHDSEEAKPRLFLPSFLISDFAVVILCVATVVCLFGLTRQFMILWEATQEGRMLERAVWATA